MGIKTEMGAGATRLAGVHQACFDDSWSATEFASLLENSAVTGLVLNEDGYDVGMALLQKLGGETEILTFGIRRSARARGLGYRFLRDCADFTRTRGASAMVLEVSSTNVAAKRLYFGFGFEQVGLRAAYYADRSDALICRLQVGA